MPKERVLVIALVMMLLVTACGTQPPADTADAPDAATTREPVTIRVGTGDSGDGLIPYNAIIAAFEQENPDIKVVVEPVEARDYYASLLAQIDAGQAPDLMLIGEDALPRFAELGAFEKLQPYLSDPQYPLDPGIYLPGVYRPGAWRDTQYLLPKDYSTVAVFYNQALFDAAGIPYPTADWTWPEFLEMARQLSDPSQEQYGVQLPAAWPRGFEYWVVSAGGQLISEDGRQIQGHMDSPAVVEALQFYADLYQTYEVAAPPTDLEAFGGGKDYFATGQAAMRLFGRWPQASYLSDPDLKDVLGVVPPPIGTEQATVIAWAGFGISAASAHKPEAWRFLRYLTGPQGAEEWANWGLPAVTAVAEARQIFTDPRDGQWLATLTMLRPIAAFASPHWGEIGEPALRQALEIAITTPDANIEAVLTAAAANAQAALDARLEPR